MGCGSRRRCLVFPEVLCGQDVDDLFAYTTSKSVRIRDARLGLLNYALMFGIFCYVVIYQLIYNWGYLTFSDPKSSVRMTIQQPTTNQCNPNEPECTDDFVRLDQLAYCCQANSSCRQNTDGSCKCDFRPDFKNYNCTYLDGAEVSRQKEDSIFVTTFTHSYSQERNSKCFSGAPNCSKLWLPGVEQMAFTAGVEDYTILIDHSVTVSAADQGSASAGEHSYTARQMDGKLAITGAGPSQDRLCSKFPGATAAGLSWTGFLFDTGKPAAAAPCLLPPGSAAGVPGADVFKISTLFEAMGVQLDNRSYEGSSHSRRYEGLVVRIAIQYHNVKLWHVPLQPPYYFYNVSVINGSTYKLVDVVDTNYPSRRMKLDKHGVLFQVSSAGKLANFSATQLLIQLTTSFTLLAVATVVVNMLATYALRFRKYYSEALYETTVDFSDLMRVDRLTDEQVNLELRAMALVPRHGERQRRVTQLLEAGYDPRLVRSTTSSMALAAPLHADAA